MGSSKGKSKTAVEKAADLAALATKSQEPADYAAAVVALTALPADKLDPKLYPFLKAHGQTVLAAPDQARAAITEAEKQAEALKAQLAEAQTGLNTARKGEAQRTREVEQFVHRTIEVHHVWTQTEFVTWSGMTQGQVSRYQLAGRGLAITGRNSDKAAVDLYAVAGNQRKALTTALKMPGKTPEQVTARTQAVTALVDGLDADRKAKAQAVKAAKAKATDPDSLVADATGQAKALTASLRVIVKGDDLIDVTVWRALVEQVDAYNARAQRNIDSKRQGVTTVKAA